ncbi:MAG: hypothetical protein WAW11_00075 [Patescibacteria group bacterium]
MSDEKQKIDEAFESALGELKKFHQDKLSLIKKYKDIKNLEQLTKIKESIKEE